MNSFTKFGAMKAVTPQATNKQIIEGIMTVKNALLKKLKNGEPTLGVGLMYPNPNCIESMARGWDWVWIDGQHGQLDYATILRAVQVAQGAGIPTIIRVASHEPGLIGMALDTGTEGLMIPMVDTPEQAGEIVKDACFPPLGNRSYGGRRVIDVGGRDYYKTANNDLLLVAQIETLEAVSRAEKIAAVEGIDALFFGPDDMKMRLGLPIDTPINESEELAKAMQTVATAARNAGKITGCVTASAESLRMALSEGYRLLVGGADIAFLRTASASKLEELRSAIRSIPCPKK